MVTPLGKAVQFFKDFGLFDIVLPFLLVFAIVYAVLDKTRILGQYTYKGESYPNKNLNAVVAFVVAMLVVAAANIVGVINEALPNIVLLLVVLVSLLLLVGVFFKTGELDLGTTHKTTVGIFIGLISIGVLLIFLGAIRNEDGKSWLEWVFNWIIEQWQGPIFASLLIFILAIATIVWLTKAGGDKTTAKRPGE
ncbi:MAG TPA: hypothetical protein VJJ21_00100 [Candidatus Nanoarchaeia archaeon]|nr:hypothetical protein [Candidatus Nanoarchaeia archaeon]